MYHTFTNRVLQADYCQQMPVIKMLNESMGKLPKYTKRLMKSVQIKNQVPKTEGQESEGREAELEHSESAVYFREVGCDKVARVVYVKGLDITKCRTGKVVMDESEVTEVILMQSSKMLACGRTPSQPNLRVNLSGRSAGNHPGQGQKNLWVRHTTRKVVQGQKISRVKKGKVMDQVAGTKEAVNMMIHKLSLFPKYRQFQME